jgi:RNA polymerase sigma factor (sigma-70 family)
MGTIALETAAEKLDLDEVESGWENADEIDSDELSSFADLGNFFTRVGRIRPMTLLEEQRCVVAKQLYADWRQARASGQVLECDPARLAASRQAFDRLWEAHLSFVVSVAKQYRYRELPILDLAQEGAIGLARAIEKFDPSREVRFTTYAKFWIRQAIHRALSDKLRLIRLPVKRTDELQRYKQAIRGLSFQLARQPTRPEIAEALGCDLARVEMLQSLLVAPVSLDMPIGHENDELSLADSLMSPDATPAEEYESQDSHAVIEQVLRRFPPVERKLIRLRFGLDGEEPRSRSEVAAVLGWSLDEIKARESELLEALAEDPRLAGFASE